MDLGREDPLDAELRSWLAFAVQKCAEVATLTRALKQPEDAAVNAALEQGRAVQAARSASPRIHKPPVQARLAVRGERRRRSPFAERIGKQRARLQLPLLPTTTIGSFPQTSAPNEIGPGVYDIQSPRVPDSAEMAKLLRKAARRIPLERLWINPDCGLKTRAWPETEAALVNMVAAARQLRSELA